jgi:hypothetical protein
MSCPHGFDMTQSNAIDVTIWINRERITMHSLAFILSIIGFGLELTAFLMTVAVL